MIEIQCTSCHTRYRIDERVLPDETPTFKCSRCGHVFNAEAIAPRPKKASVHDIASAPARSNRSEAAQSAPKPAQPALPPSPPAPAPQTDPEPDASAAVSPATEELINRPFQHETSEPDAGENLSFDFSDEGTLADTAEAAESTEVSVRDEDEWQVGEPPEDFTLSEGSLPSGRVAPRIAVRPDARAEKPRRAADGDADDERFAEPRFASAAPSRSASVGRGHRADELPDDVAYIEARGAVHSAGSFIGLFFLVAVAFGLASMVICGEPIASARMLSQMPGIGARFTRPIVPAMLVALHDVRAAYAPLKGGATALVISGTAENLGNDPLHDILIAVDLLDGAQRQIAGKASYCGNGLSQKMIGEMTPREIEFLERLDPQRNFAVSAMGSAPFLMVFIDPPRQTAAFRISVAKAVAAQSSAPPTPGA